MSPRRSDTTIDGSEDCNMLCDQLEDTERNIISPSLEVTFTLNLNLGYNGERTMSNGTLLQWNGEGTSPKLENLTLRRYFFDDTALHFSLHVLSSTDDTNLAFIDQEMLFRRKSLLLLLRHSFGPPSPHKERTNCNQQRSSDCYANNHGLVIILRS